METFVIGEDGFGDGSGVCAAEVDESGLPHVTGVFLDKGSDPGVRDDAEKSGVVTVNGEGLNVGARDVGVGEAEVVTEVGRLVNIGFLSLPCMRTSEP
jgi:hypothetical protein